MVQYTRLTLDGGTLKDKVYVGWRGSIETLCRLLSVENDPSTNNNKPYSSYNHHPSAEGIVAF